MSYEGHVQHLCAKGHRFDSDAYDHEAKCFCGGESTFQNAVDETNCESWGHIPDTVWEVLCLTEAEGGTCNLGHYHVTAEATYRPPTDNELKMIRHWRPGSQIEFVPLVYFDHDGVKTE